MNLTMRLVVLCLLLLSCGCQGVSQQLKDEVSKCPKVPDFSQFISKIPKLGRRLTIASPCVGVHACGEALKVMGTPADSNNVYDLEEGYANVLIDQLTKAGMKKIVLHLGEKSGNLLNTRFQDLETPVDWLIAGPPCPPWAGQGKKQGLNDSRGQVFLRVLMWLYFFVKSAGLLGCILENVLGITYQYDGLESTMSIFVSVLQKFMPEFAWSVDILKATDYLLPHTRVRVFLRGIRKEIAAVVPAVLPPFGSRTLEEALGDFPNCVRTDLSEPQQNNLKKFEMMIVDCLKEGKINRDDLVVVPVDRADNKTYDQNMTINAAPTLTCHNAYLFILSAGDVIDGTPDEQRRFFRKFKNCERLTLQGLPAETALLLEPSKAVKAAGNAYPMPLIIATLAPMLPALTESSIQLAEWPPQRLLSQKVPEDMQAFVKALKRKGQFLFKLSV